MSLCPKVGMLLVAGAVSVTMLAGCGHTEGQASNATVTLGNEAAEPLAKTETTGSENVTLASANESTSPSNGDSTAKPSEENASATSGSATPATNPTADETRKFNVEGPENSIRVSFDDVDLLKVMNLDPVPADAPERLPKWMKALDGKRIRVRGFMFPPFQDTGIRGFVLARDNQICCFGRTAKEYDLVDTFLRKGVTTDYIQNRPFDVVGIFRIKSEIEKFTAMYELEDAIVIEK